MAELLKPDSDGILVSDWKSKILMRISRSNFVFGCLICCGLISCKATRTDTFYAANISLDATITSNNLHQAWELLHDETYESDHFPFTLDKVRISSADAKFFLCPGTGSKARSLSKIGSWTDYVYVGGATDNLPHGALLISPPENHDNRYGYVLCVAGSIFQLPPDKTRSIIREPWLLASNSLQGNVDYFKTNIQVHIPDRLRSFYPASK